MPVGGSIGSAPVLEGAGRRWFFKHLASSFLVGIALAEWYWRGYYVPRRERRDEYYRQIGVEWNRLVDY